MLKLFGFEITGRVLKWVGFERDMDLLNFGNFFPSINEGLKLILHHIFVLYNNYLGLD